MCSCRGPSTCKQGRRIYNTLLLQAMALYIHGPLRCKDLLGRIPNPHSRPALAAPQHAPGPRSDARSQRTPPGEIMHRSAAPYPAAAPATERPAPPAHLRSDRLRTSSQTGTCCTRPCDGKAPGGHCPTHSKPHPDRPQISQPEPPRLRRRASKARHNVRHTARHFFKNKAQIRHILAVLHPL